MNAQKKWRLMAVCVALCLVAGVLWAFAPDKVGSSSRTADAASDIEPLPKEMQDRAFDKYIDMNLLGQAWTGLDPAGLADAALQLAEGERVLFRSHKAISAEKVFHIAVRVAAEKRDKATLERLAKAAQKRGDKELATEIAAATKLASESRNGSEINLSIETTSPEAFAACHEFLRQVTAAKVAGDRTALETLQKQVASNGIPKEQQRQFAKVAENALSAVPKDAKVDATSKTLNSLAMASRVFPPPHKGPVHNSWILGIKYTVTGDGFEVVERVGSPRYFRIDGSFQRWVLDAREVIVNVGGTNANTILPTDLDQKIRNLSAGAPNFNYIWVRDVNGNNVKLWLN